MSRYVAWLHLFQTRSRSWLDLDSKATKLIYIQIYRLDEDTNWQPRLAAPNDFVPCFFWLVDLLTWQFACGTCGVSVDEMVSWRWQQFRQYAASRYLHLYRSIAASSLVSQVTGDPPFVALTSHLYCTDAVHQFPADCLTGRWVSTTHDWQDAWPVSTFCTVTDCIFDPHIFHKHYLN